MKFIRTIKRFLHNQRMIAQNSEKIIEGIGNQSALMNRKLRELNDLVRHLAIRQEETAHQFNVNNGLQTPPGWTSSVPTTNEYRTLEEAMSEAPLLFARNTYNTSHPDYDVNIVRNFPNKAFNHQVNMQNPVWDELKKMIKDNEITAGSWDSILRDTLEEIKNEPHADQVFERKLFVEQYIYRLEKENKAFYRPGWVNLDDAIFLYWVVRKLKPKVIVQTGVCNGLSSAFMMLALAKNGLDGTLHVIDIPFVYNSNDPAWKVKGNVYGVIIPEEKTSGWLVPNAYRDRFEVLNGDAKDLLPPLLKKLGTCDMFYHDSDHTYDHMMFEFEESKKYLTPKGVIVSDDISWNASLWDFADQYHVPAYNYRGSMGIACFP